MAIYDENQLAKDRDISMQNGIRFLVSVKDGRGKKWNDVSRGIEDLFIAMREAEGLHSKNEHFGVAVFALTVNGGGVFYWNSINPDLLGSKVLENLALE